LQIGLCRNRVLEIAPVSRTDRVIYYRRKENAVEFSSGF